MSRSDDSNQYECRDDAGEHGAERQGGNKCYIEKHIRVILTHARVLSSFSLTNTRAVLIV